MSSAFINHIGKFLPGLPISNDQIEDYLGKINGRPSRMKSRILKQNGILQRHYAIDQNQQVVISNCEMAAHAVRDVLSRSNVDPHEVDLLCAATTWPDHLVPGFASMVHGILSELPPLEILSVHGVCSAGVSALKYAAAQVQTGQKRQAITVASELASRLMTHTHFEAQPEIKAGKGLSFDTEFLRWMLSDGAGAFLIEDQPNPNGISLRLEWIELASHANAYPTCMYAGMNEVDQRSWMDYSSYVEAAEAGAINLRQNVRILDNIVKLGVEGWLKLLDQDRVDVNKIDWFVCHYSSHVFRSQIVELLDKAGCLVPEEKWFTNLYTRGNTGCASIYLMLEELFYSGKMKPGQTVFCMVPESGRFTTAYLMFTVVGEASTPTWNIKLDSTAQPAVANDQGVGSYLLQKLTLTWLEFERKLRSVRIMRKLERGEFSIDDYKALLRTLRPQVVEGSRWLTRAASNLTENELRSAFIRHAKDEHRDFELLDQNYVAVGGSLEEITQAKKNVGGEALSAFIFNQGSQPNPIDLIGSIFIIETVGHRVAGQWANQIKQHLGLSDTQVSFFSYHGENDTQHLDRWHALFNAEWMTHEIAERIVQSAKITARLYLLQLEEIQ
ncbi:3-oxoacyl-[acyl-carrier-protein] synthase III C-terminal domain-containing protein [Leptolyngbya sp. AN03gr2]|uniref:3-oxoacyl-[acyl-carrier-protein] synthase III C-terminal domain-containing protein n=1 Tax=unclassified Leptolyngbya TaxID=2650499 RepID=UPI003D31FB4B